MKTRLRLGFAYSLMISGLANHIVLINRERERAEGHRMDLNHGLSFVQPSRIYVGELEDCRDADVVVVTAGANQRPGESRLGLVGLNTEIFIRSCSEAVGRKISSLWSRPQAFPYLWLRLDPAHDIRGEVFLFRNQPARISDVVHGPPIDVRPHDSNHKWVEKVE
jgi:hypothetical protein